MSLGFNMEKAEITLKPTTISSAKQTRNRIHTVRREARKVGALNATGGTVWGRWEARSGAGRERGREESVSNGSTPRRINRINTIGSIECRHV
ncbi:hypothetical protein GWI33_003206 [Rhynchophorus ferrugineus]|uniref:Uncharacterized protein n=1 Tax=Rhynchophorus ferrugineus TaxID=354439 RepID=A0A834IVN4_RHYFE|nr:hypothetical protein GWI33_003206 [Rhynchophorus ferrugineus]